MHKDSCPGASTHELPCDLLGGIRHGIGIELRLRFVLQPKVDLVFSIKAGTIVRPAICQHLALGGDSRQLRMGIAAAPALEVGSGFEQRIPKASLI